MRISSTLLVLAVLGCHESATMPASTVAQRAPAHALAPQLPTAFIDVTVVPMDVERELPHQTVVTREGRIVALGPTATTAVPDDAKRIERNGSGFLIPGLADMHVHTFVDDELVLDIANGVTTVRNLHGVPGHLAWRDSIARGLKFGPRFYTSGPIVDGVAAGTIHKPGDSHVGGGRCGRRRAEGLGLRLPESVRRAVATAVRGARGGRGAFGNPDGRAHPDGGRSRWAAAGERAIRHRARRDVSADAIRSGAPNVAARPARANAGSGSIPRSTSSPTTRDR